MDAFAAGLSPKLYRKNPFRLLGIPSHAKRRTVKRRANALVGLIEAGDQDGLCEEVIGGFTGAPDEPVLREASHRLEQPEARLLDELFWFRLAEDGPGEQMGGPGGWPVRDLVQRWIEDEAFGGPDGTTRATHNLAVFYHLIAVEIELTLTECEPDDRVRDGLRDDAICAWSAALDRWHRLSDDPAFRDWLHGRFDEVSGGRVEDGAFEGVSQLAREGAMAVMAGIALDHARRSRPDEVARLRTLAVERGEAEIFTGAAERLVQPRIEQQMRVIRREKETLQEDKAEAMSKVGALFAQLVPIIDEMSLVLGPENRMVGDFGDALAELVNQGAVTTLLATEGGRDYPGAQAMLMRIRPMVRTGELRDQVDRNLSAISCHFCRHDKGRPREDARDYEVKLFRINRVENAIGRVHFQTLAINVPRCGHCWGGDNAALAYYEVREKLMESWFVGAEPTDADSNAFVDSNGNPAPMRNIPTPPPAIWERAATGGSADGGEGGLLSRISGLFGGGAGPDAHRPDDAPEAGEGRSSGLSAGRHGEHVIGDDGVCKRCGCSLKAIQKFGWGCS